MALRMSHARQLELRAARQALAESLPWVTRLRRPVPCEGFMAHTPLRAVFGTDEQRAARPRCKNLARWRFRALRRSCAEDGAFCWSHLMSRGLYGDMDEIVRTERWLAHNPHTCLRFPEVDDGVCLLPGRHDGDNSPVPE